MTTERDAVGLAEVADLPSLLPRPSELDDVELALCGVDLDVVIGLAAQPGEVAPQAGDRLVLTDPEGTPLALLEITQTASDATEHRVTGDLRALQPPEHGPFRRLRRSAADVATELAGREALAVPVDQPLQVAHVEALARRAAGRAVLLLPLVGAGSPRLLSPAGLVRATIAAANHLPDVLVVPVPLARRGDPVADRELRERTARAYGAADVLHLDDVDGAEPVDRTRQRLAAGQPLAHAYAPAVAAAVLATNQPLDRQGVVVLLSGLSGSGKSTVARALAERIDEQFARTLTLLDGDVVRRMLSAGLSFAKADRELNIRRIGFVAAEIARHGGLAICCPIAPYASSRADVRSMVDAAGGNFVLIHISTPLAECERRDRKGLYAKARAGLIPEFTGISDPYEEPTDADLAIDTTNVPVDDAVGQIVELLEQRGFLSTGTSTRTEPSS